MQPASDMFLGWSRGPKRDFFIRQLRDMKLSLMVETFGRTEMTFQQLAMSRVRAVEHGRSVLIAATSGVSAIITPAGVVRQQSEIFTAQALATILMISSA